MSKPKIVLAAVGGVIALVSLALGILIWSEASGRAEKSDDLNAATSSANTLMAKPVYPGPKGVKALESNRVEYAAWSASARELAAQGDRSFERTTAPAFKSFLVEDAHRLAELPGGVEGKLVKPGFAFGFSSYITEDKMPADADLANLQREWYDISTVVKALAVTGVVEIADVVRQTKAPVPEEQDAAAARKAKKRRNAKAEEEAAAKAPLVSTFTVVFRAKPQGLVNAVNAIVSSDRFIVVDEMSFAREEDELANLLSGETKKENAPSRRLSRRRNRFAEAEAEDDDQPKGLVAGGIVTDPARASLLKVSMTFSVYDFRTRQEASSDEKGKGEGK